VAPLYSFGDVLLASLVFSDGQSTKKRPVLVVTDFGDNDLLVVPITSHAARVETDTSISEWKNAGLRLPSCVRTEKLATIQKSLVIRKLGTLMPADLEVVRANLAVILKRIIEQP